MFERLVWFVPAAVAVAGLARPRAALVALAAALPLFGTARGGPYLAALDAACLAALLLSLRERAPARSGLDHAVLAFAAVAAASLVPLAYHPPSWAPGALAGLARALANAPTGSPLFTWRAALDLALGCGLYLATRRAFAGRSLRPLALGLGGGLALLLLLGLAEQAGAVDLGGYRSTAAAGRLHALFSNSGWLGEYVAIALPLPLAALVSGGARARLAGALLALLALAGLLLSQQRGAWLALAVQAALAAALVGRERWRDAGMRRAGLLLAAALGGGLALAAVQPGLLQGVRARLASPDLLQRPAMWLSAARLAAERPLLGWGLGAYELALSGRAAPATVAANAHGEAHSTLLHVAAERGSLGLLSLALLVATAWASARALLREGRDRALAAGAALALAGAATYGLVQYLWFQPAVGALVWMVLGCVASPMPAAATALVRRTALALALASAVGALARLAGTAPPTSADDRSYGFHAPEPGGVRWTEARAARRLACSGGQLALELANGHPLGPARPLEVTIRLDGRRAAVLPVPGGWQRAVVPVRGACDDGSAVVELLVRPSFRPHSEFRRHPGLPRSNDERELGVAIRTLRIE